MPLFDLATILITLTAVFGWINYKFLGLPSPIGLLVIGLSVSVVLILTEFLSGVRLYGDVVNVLHQIDFYDALMHGMLAFLLFAGALHVDALKLKKRGLLVGTMATVGVAISTIITGCGSWYAANYIFKIPLPLPWALVLGVVISPTDPVAVLSILKTVKVPEPIQIDLAGESLLNDGVAIVLFTILLAIATPTGSPISAVDFLRLFMTEALGGAVLGIVTGYVAYRAMAWIDDYAIEVLISLALVTSTYAIADRLQVSGALAVVAAGLLIGTRGPAYAMSKEAERYLFAFWTLIDEILNSILFLLIGLELLVIGIQPAFVGLAALVPGLSLIARVISVSMPALLLNTWQPLVRGTIPILTWGGVRGGISIALALSLPLAEARPVIITATYVAALFTIVVQGLSLGFVARNACKSR